jgi:hypothetical protein
LIPNTQDDPLGPCPKKSIEFATLSSIGGSV